MVLAGSSESLARTRVSAGLRRPSEGQVRRRARATADGPQTPMPVVARAVGAMLDRATPVGGALV